MGITKVKDQIENLAFSYRELDLMGFDVSFIKDYLDQVRNIEIIADSSDVVIDQVNTNTNNIESNRLRISLMEPVVESNKNRLDIVEPKVSSNIARLDVIEPIVKDHTEQIEIIDTRSQNNTDEIAKATGQLVGNNDFASSSVGGVVLLASLVSDLAKITTPNIDAAPDSYDVAYTNTVKDLTNANKAKINEIVDKVNSIIAGQIAAKQMSSS